VIYYVHKTALKHFEISQGDLKICWGILAFETRFNMYFDASEKEQKKLKAKVGFLKNYFKNKHPNIQL
jgi:hypothetical protein